MELQKSVGSSSSSTKNAHLTSALLPPVLDHIEDLNESMFAVVESYFRSSHSGGNGGIKQVVREQLESFNFLVDTMIPKTISMHNPTVIRSENDFHPFSGKHLLEIHLEYHDMRIHPPYIYENNGATKIMFPQEARVRGFDYASKMTVTLHVAYVVRSAAHCDEFGPSVDERVPPTILRKCIPNVSIGHLPVMVRSRICMLTQHPHLTTAVTGECRFDMGGYFIIKGSEKVVISQERPKENQASVFFCKKRQGYYADIKSVPEQRFISPKCVELFLHSSGDQSIIVTIPRLKTPLDLFVVFRALGVESDKDICNHILCDVSKEINPMILDSLKNCAAKARHVLSYDAAIDKLAAAVAFVPSARLHHGGSSAETMAHNRREYAKELLFLDLFPHCKTMDQKKFLLGYMARKLLLVHAGLRTTEDRDSNLNKRVDLCGVLINTLFRNFLNKLVKDQNRCILHEIDRGNWRASMDYMSILNETNICRMVHHVIVTNGLKTALATGDFSIKQTNSNKVGVAQVLNRLNYPSAISHLRRMNTPLEKNGELVEPRKMHSTIWGYVCPPETPEGHSIGTVKNLSVLAHITIPSANATMVLDYVRDFVCEFHEITSLESMYGCVKLMVNGCWMGVVARDKDPLECYWRLKQLKWKGLLGIYTSVVMDFVLLEIRVCNEGGRLTRPVLRVENNRALITNEMIERIRKGELQWNDLLTDQRLPYSVIEYIDNDEENHAKIAMYCKGSYLLQSPFYRHIYTYSEIHLSLIFGVLASMIPFPDHNQAPRNTYQCAMGKQAMGMGTTNFDARFDRTAFRQTYLSRPLVDTRMMHLLGLDQIPYGYMTHVAIMIYTGFNQEDSLLVNKGSVDRGLFQNTMYHTERDEDKTASRDVAVRCRPDPTKTRGMKLCNYDKIQPDGFMKENEFVESRDIIMAKVSPIKEHRNDPTQPFKFEDQSCTIRTVEETYIDKNMTGRNGDGNNFAKVRTRALRSVSVGDKFSSRHGQKGTCGLLVPEENMPFTRTGMRPDIVMNPHAVPSRMTIAHLQETLFGKMLLELGLMGDGSPFNDDLSVKTLGEHLVALGMESCGNELMVNAFTGEWMECSIFFGPVYYQRLKHMVNDKMHARSLGKPMNLTRQPQEGRSRDGGFRVGEMEKDGLIAHGMTKVCRERLMEVSDQSRWCICKCCGMFAPFNDLRKVGQHRLSLIETSVDNKCLLCDNTTEFGMVEVPFAMKLLFQELMTINVIPRILLDQLKLYVCMS